jgi:multiple sugar transport system permease protein
MPAARPVTATEQATIVSVWRGVIAAAAIITFLLGWAQFLFPLVLTSDLSSQPVTVVVAALNGQRIVPFTLLMACGVVTAAVPGIVAIALNRFIISGVTSGAVK